MSATLHAASFLLRAPWWAPVAGLLGLGALALLAALRATRVDGQRDPSSLAPASAAETLPAEAQPTGSGSFARPMFRFDPRTTWLMAWSAAVLLSVLAVIDAGALTLSLASALFAGFGAGVELTLTVERHQRHPATGTPASPAMVGAPLEPAALQRCPAERLVPPPETATRRVGRPAHPRLR